MDAGKILANSRIVPVLTIENVDQCEALAECLLETGLNSIEITLRSSAALASIERVSRSFPQIIVGAGSVRTATQLQQVKDAGAQFAVSPGSSASLLAKAEELAMPFVPAAATPTEMIALLDKGYNLQKFFPAEASGGLSFLKAISKPLPTIRFFPTGGINGKLAKEYLEFEAVACIGGSWFIPEDKLKAGDFKSITQSARQALAAL